MLNLWEEEKIEEIASLKDLGQSADRVLRFCLSHMVKEHARAKHSLSRSRSRYRLGEFCPMRSHASVSQRLD